MSKKKIEPKGSYRLKRPKYVAFLLVTLIVTLGVGAVLGRWRGLSGIRSLVATSPRVTQPVSPPTIPPPSNPSKEYIYGGGKLIATETAKSDQTITFTAISDKIYGDAPFAISATASSALSVSFVVTAGPATLSGNTLTLTGAGSVSIRADQSGNDGFNPAQSVTHSFTVAKAAQTITFNTLGGKTYGDAAFTVSASSSSGLAISFSIVSGPATISGSTVTITGAGSVAVRASQAGDANYNAAAVVDQSFTVAKAAQTITFSTLAGKTYGDPPFTVSASSSSGLAISFSIVSGPATISGSTVTITGVGSVTVRASQAGDANYNAAAVVDQSFTVAKAAQTITFNTLAGKIYSDPPFTISASSSSSLSVGFSIVSGPATLAGSTVTITGVGSVTVRASQAGDSNYNAAADVDRPFSASGYAYRRSISIDHTKVPNTDQSNFPLLISGTYSYLATAGNGGNVQNASGYDLIFTSDSGCATKLNHEVETYTAATGGVNYWVKVPTVSHTTSDTVIYMCYGNSSITTDQSNKTAVWDSNFKSVYHLPNGTTLSANDSTANAVNGTLENATATTGQISGGASFNGSSAGINLGNTSTWAMGSGDYTFEAWIKVTSNPAAVGAILQKDAIGERQVALQFDNYFTANSINLIHFNDDGTFYWRQTPANSLSTNAWHHVAGVRSSSSLLVYIDGVSQTLSSAYTNGPLGTMKSAASVAYIGRDAYSGYEEYFNGLIDEARVSNTARSADWIKTEYNNQSSPSTFYTISSTGTNGYAYRRSISIDHTKVPNTDQSNFPLLISGTYSYLATAANGGNVQSANGYDIIFTSDSGCATKLNHEVEAYTAATGGVNYWVKVPTVSHTSDTVIYMCYGNSSITTDQSNKTGVWDSSFKLVAHLSDGTTLSGNDSTSYGNNGSLNGSSATSGQIYGGATMDGSSNYLDFGNSSTLDITSTLTLEVWIKPASASQYAGVLGKWTTGGGTNNAYSFYLGQDVGNNKFTFIVEQSNGGIAALVANDTYSSGVWTHFVCTADGSTLRIYKNGTVISQTASYNGTIKSITKDVTAGRLRQEDNLYSYGGSLDEVRISSAARSADWISTEYNNQSSPATFYVISSSPLASAPRGADMTTPGIYNASNTSVGTSGSPRGGPGIVTRMLFDVASVVHASGIEGPSLTFLNVIGQYRWLESATPAPAPSPAANDVNHTAAGS
jgi:hypothetical protein